ncbi:hypothetical protein KC207_01595 [Phycicoccus sp. BSK3Z-2]|uniref:DUF4190 domain-containing protein n=1 Tax=Phycicoccus avicenniae TaxID=2828860 RepID=A0A941D4Z7_9MICO|nr:hypothetical protein [Phycicoccus avicenniae]MBR7741985.1 hypothetical protein [Phycicoccus avicenniae]
MSSDDERRDAADERQDDAASCSDPTAPPPGSWSGGTSSWTQPGSGATDAYGRPVPPPPGATQPIDPAPGGTAQIPQDDGRTAPYGQSPTYGQAPPSGQAAPYGQSPTYGQAPPYGQSPTYGQAAPYGQSPTYGQAPPPGGPAGYGAPPYAAPQQTSTSAIVLIVLSALALVSCCNIFAIGSLVMGVVATGRQSTDPERARSLTKGGWWVFGVSMSLVVLAIIIFFVLGLSGAFDEPGPYGESF